MTHRYGAGAWKCYLAVGRTVPFALASGLNAYATVALLGIVFLCMISWRCRRSFAVSSTLQSSP